ncbi:MAG: ISAs1 family transposase [Lachnospiraceae bacterium]|nr:ISAs1 family transposase [Lachnospiraceae bacterium]
MMNIRLFFSDLKDHRQTMKVQHDLLEIIAMTLIAIAADCDGWDEIEDFCQQYEAWLKKVVGLTLKEGVPSADTFERVWQRLDSKEFKASFRKWTESIRIKTKGEVINIDGKTSRGSGDDKQRPVHMVSAWLSEQKMVLGQIAVPEKTNEITAVPELIKMLDIGGCIVTADAMSCQRAIVSEIIRKKAEYVIGLKGNQNGLLEYAELLFEGIRKEPGLYEVQSVATRDRGHGRIEIRTYYLSTELSGLSQKSAWKGLKAIGMVHSVITNQKTGKVTEAYRYYITSLTDIETFSRAVREHWGIEASLHHVLDVSFQEDASKIHKDNAPDNLAVIRHFVIAMLKYLPARKKNVSARRKRKMCGRDPELLLKALELILAPQEPINS